MSELTEGNISLVADKLKDYVASDDPRWSEGGDDEETKKIKFQEKRKQHYNEFERVKMARLAMKDDEDEDDGE